MSAEAETTFRTYFAAFQHGDLDAIVSVYAEPTTYSQPFVPEPLTDRASIRAFEEGMFSGFSDIDFAIDWVVADNDRVAAGLTVTCIHTGELPLPDGPGKALKLTISPVQEHIPIYLASLSPKSGEREQTRNVINL